MSAAHDAGAAKVMGQGGAAPVRKLSIPAMAAYGTGQIAESLHSTGFGAFLIFYYQQIIGVSGTLTALALAISLIFDSVADPVVGALSDRTRSRLGRRHPFIILGALPLALAFYLLFSPPQGLTSAQAFLWLTLFSILARQALTFYLLPLTALGAEMVRDYTQRSTLYNFTFMFGALSGTAAYMVALKVFFPTTGHFNPGMLNPEGYTRLGFYFGVGMVLAMVICVAGTWREIPHLVVIERAANRLSVRQLVREVSEAFRNVSFRSLFFGTMLATIVLTIDGVFGTYMGLHFWGLTTEQQALLAPVSLVGLLVGGALVPAVTRWLDKKMTLIAAAVVSIFVGNSLVTTRLFDPAWFPDNGSPVLLPLIALTSFIGAAMAPLVYANLNSMFADIVDEHELEIGERREGIVFAASSFARKVTSSMGLVIGGMILDFIHFPRSAVAGTVHQDVLWQMGLLSGPVSGVLVLIGVLMFMGHRLDRARHGVILAELERRRVAGPASQ